MAQDMQDAGNVSAELDAMVCDLIGGDVTGVLHILCHL